MTKPKLFPSLNANVSANVFLAQASGFYDKSTKVGERITLLKGCILNSPDPNGWIARDIGLLVKSGYLEQVGSNYKVLKPISGSTSGTAAAVLGAGFKPAGYHLWKFRNGQSIHEVGEK
jgi:hypothetical protein